MEYYTLGLMTQTEVIFAGFEAINVSEGRVDYGKVTIVNACAKVAEWLRG